MNPFPFLDEVLAVIRPKIAKLCREGCLPSELEVVLGGETSARLMHEVHQTLTEWPKDYRIAGCWIAVDTGTPRLMAVRRKRRGTDPWPAAGVRGP